MDLNCARSSHVDRLGCLPHKMMPGLLQNDQIGAVSVRCRSSSAIINCVFEDKVQINVTVHLGRFKRQKSASLQRSPKKFTNGRNKRYINGVNEGNRVQKHCYCVASVSSRDNFSSEVDSFEATVEGVRYYDFAVIGSGIAGLRYALEVAKYGTVAIITKGESHDCNTNYAQGGVCAVLSPLDSVENHIQDTIVAGAYLCDEETVKVVCSEGPERVRELINIGASFDRSNDGSLHLTKEGGHSHNRVVHAADMTGREIERALLKTVHKNPNIRIFEHHAAIDLLTSQEGSSIFCHGVDTINKTTNKIVRFISKVTLLATGGVGHIYPTTTNPLVATGDGIAMAYRAKAIVSNMEFVQFHPTTLSDEGLPIKPPHRENVFLISEAVRGAGGILYNQSHERFMPDYDARGELAPRDIVARSIDDQLKKRSERYVLLDISHKPKDEILSHFPNIAAECLKYGLDVTRNPIPVVPAAHYICGGVQTGIYGETSLKGLYAAGEVACTGLHGANRLASNSLLEGLVFAQRAVEPSLDYKLMSDIKKYESSEWPYPAIPSALSDSKSSQEKQITNTMRKRLQRCMWDYVGIVRSLERLMTADKLLNELELEWEDQLFQLGWRPSMVNLHVCEMRNLFCCAKLVVSSALSRKESRGLHFVLDYPTQVESERRPTKVIHNASKKSSWSTKTVHSIHSNPSSFCKSEEKNRDETFVGKSFDSMKTP